MDHERLELEEAESDLLEVEEHHDSLKSEQKKIELQVQQFNVKLKREKEIRLQKDRHRQLLTLKELPELELYQKMLALDIQTVRKDMMKFLFSNIDTNDWSREFTMTVDVSTDQYKGKICTFFKCILILV